MPLQRIGIEAQGFEALAREFQQLPGVVAKAERRALKRTGDWARSQGAKAMALESNIQQGKLKKARRVLRQMRADEVSVFMGTMPLKSHYLGKPRQQKRGARVGKITFAGAFVARMQSGYVGIYKRRGTARLPIDEMEAPVNLSASDFQRIATQADAKLVDEFGHNLRYYAGWR
ncbi:MAG: phage tail protein [Salinisphaera sp.]|jgi:hypothetical protein|nr:phage tail protein [Salinisphaera sp.]